MIGDPLSKGSLQVTVTVPEESAVAVPMVGAPGTVAGVTELEAADWAPVPTALIAATLKV
ncbi:MAG: hypothetical protein ACLP2J_07995 [Acidimicrobiales bacterium]